MANYNARCDGQLLDKYLSVNSLSFDFNGLYIASDIDRAEAKAVLSPWSPPGVALLAKILPPPPPRYNAAFRGKHEPRKNNHDSSRIICMNTGGERGKEEEEGGGESLSARNR